MVALAIIMVCALFVLIVSDVIKRKSLIRLASQLDEERSNVLKKLDGVTIRIHALASQIENKRTRPNEAQAKKETATLSDLVAVLVERPYTKLTIASGVRYITALRTTSGEMLLEHFLSEEMAISQEFHQPVPKGIAELMLKAALGQVTQYSLREKPHSAELASGM